MEFLEFANQYIDFAEIEAVCIILISIIISFTIYYIAVLFGRSYGATLERAFDKNKNREQMTKKELKVWRDYENYLNNLRKGV